MSEHIMSSKFYYAIWIALLCLTVITAAVSFITALIAVAMVDGLHRNSTEPARIIYESDPRSQP